MESLDGIEDLRMSGARAVFRASGDAPSEADVLAALKMKGLGLVSYGMESRPRAERLYLVDAGVT